MKTLLINGSPRKEGNTFAALSLVAASLEEEGVEAEIFQLPKEPVRGCISCRKCGVNQDNRCVFKDDAVNVILEKLEGSDALVLGSPVYYAGPNGALLAVLNRVFFAGSQELFAGKPAAAVCAVRRGGATATLEVLQKYFTISGMPIAPSTYWPMIHGLEPGEALRDDEGVQEMRMTGKTIAWMLKCFEAGKAAGVPFPAVPGGEKVFTNFIR